jgi:hypothetical protein
MLYQPLNLILLVPVAGTHLDATPPSNISFKP